ncbi:hypothetical protein ANN_14654 [Periplaneta americana]|uniref:Uncharacterized protein n=1 Tax=Periplaneta americana TaxID=6978 RepID=A0ABQ8SYH3_PERAM|nr:hypothetical protein ANN_14654 [Periplaneta americana]
MAGLCEGGNEPSGSLKAICDNAGEMMVEAFDSEKPQPGNLRQNRTAPPCCIINKTISWKRMRGLEQKQCLLNPEIEILLETDDSVLPLTANTSQLFPCDHLINQSRIGEVTSIQNRSLRGAVSGANGVAQSVKALACLSEVALGRGFDLRLG